MRYDAGHAFHTPPTRLADAAVTDATVADATGPAPGAGGHDRRICRPRRVVAAVPGVRLAAGD